jgi:WD40 repeat protein
VNLVKVPYPYTHSQIGLSALAVCLLCACGGHKGGGKQIGETEDGGTGKGGGFIPQVGGAPDAYTPAGLLDYAPCGALGQGSVSATAFSPDGTLMAVAGSQLRLLSTDDWHEVRKFDQSSIEFFYGSLAFTAGGSLLVSGLPDGNVGIWQVDDGAFLYTLILPVSSDVPSWQRVAVSSVGLLALTDGASVSIWDASQRLSTRTLWPTQGSVDRMALSEGGDLLAMAEFDRPSVDGGTQHPTTRISLWDVATGHLLKTIASEGRHAEGLAFSPKADVLVALLRNLYYCRSQGCDSVVNFYRVSDGKGMRNTGSIFNVSAAGTLTAPLAFAPQGDLLALLIRDGYNSTLSIIRTSDAAVVNAFQYFSEPLCFSPDGRLVFARGRSVEIRDARDGTILQLVPFGPGSGASAFSPDGQWLATEDGSNAYLWRLADGAIASQFPGLGVRVQSLAFSPDSQTIATGGDDAIVRMWKITDAANPVVLQQDQPVTEVTFSPDGTVLASGDSAGKVVLWSTKDMALLHTLQAQDSVKTLVFSRDGKRLVSGGANPSIIVWNAEMGLAIANASHGREVVALAFSPDGSQLASAATRTSCTFCYPDNGDPDINLWQVTDSALVLQATIATETAPPAPDQIFNNGVFGLAFSPDGGTLLTAGPQDTWQLYRLPRGEPIGQFNRIYPGVSFAISADTTRIAIGGYPIEIWCRP